MKTKKFLRNLLLTIGALVATVVVVALGFWLFDGRSPQAYIVSKMFPQITIETYETAKAEATDKSVTEIPEGVEFPREVRVVGLSCSGFTEGLS